MEWITQTDNADSILGLETLEDIREYIITISEDNLIQILNDENELNNFYQKSQEQVFKYKNNILDTYLDQEITTRNSNWLHTILQYHEEFITPDLFCFGFYHLPGLLKLLENNGCASTLLTSYENFLKLTKPKQINYVKKLHIS